MSGTESSQRKKQWNNSDSRAVGKNPDKGSDHYDWCNGNADSDRRKNQAETSGLCSGIEEKSIHNVRRCKRILFEWGVSKRNARKGGI